MPCATGGDAERGTLGQSHVGHAALGGLAAPAQAGTDRQSLEQSASGKPEE